MEVLIFLVRAYFPQSDGGSIDVNSNFPPQTSGDSGGGVPSLTGFMLFTDDNGRMQFTDDNGDMEYTGA